ncbi:MAG: glycosyltransferase [Nitrospira sp.]|nr:glycosyltransferase [Nitrospira sp.]
MPLVSVIIPTYNRADYVADAIRSVLTQDYHRVEIIVADDGSVDNTADIVSQFGDAVNYLSLPHRGQPAATRNAALQAANGEYIALLDSDDLFLPGRLARQVAALAEHPEAGLVYSNGYFFREAPGAPMGRVLDGLPTPSGDVLPDLLRGNFLSTPIVLFRRTCLDVVGMFDERPDIVAVEDYDFWLRIAAKFPVIYAPGDVAAIRRHGQSISGDVATLRTGVLRVLAKLEATYPHLARQHRDALNEGYARNHGAVALARLEQRQILSGLGHAFQALGYSLRTPGLGTKPFLEWIGRRRARGTGARP